ncbi:MAG: hypothetical protein Q7S48_01240 [bacterium]|nr:hypothetical protein [bacterium]
MYEKLPENIENNPTPKSLESELSPEVLKMVMAKAQDIDKNGIAFSMIGHYPFDGANKWKYKSFEELETILSRGLLGTTERQSGVALEKWKKNISERGGIIHFNIVGRSGDQIDRNNLYKYPGKPLEIGVSEYMIRGDEGVTVVFDLTPYKEIEPQSESDEWVFSKEAWEKRGLKQRTYWVDRPAHITKNWRELIDRGVKLNPRSEYGFVMPYRLAPRYFRGLVISSIIRNLALTGDNSKDRDKQEYLKASEGVLENRISLLLDTMLRVYKDKSDQLLPIYDTEGNLQWPKQMTYEEVKKFVAERDKDKKENKEQKDDQAN